MATPRSTDWPVGYALAGVVRRYARAAAEPRLEDTAIMFKKPVPVG